ncbi:hypothetical protein [Rhizobium mongolense]|uniref:hypothetical protein n=1 Tax=Rhizobium mongolense TaxID=57676 RepID=UPI0034A20331
MDIPAALTGISTAISIVKQLNEIDQKVDESVFKLKIAEATANLAEAKMGLVDAQEVLREKDKELTLLKERLRYRAENLTDYRGYRYRVTPRLRAVL